MADNISFDDLIPAAASFEDLVPKRTTGQEIGRQLGLTGRAAYEGFTAPATAALEFGRGLYNLGAAAIGSESRLASPAQQQSEMLTRAGVPEPETRLERAVQAGTQAMVGTGASSKIPGLVANVAKEVPIAGISAALSQPAAEVVKNYTGSDLAATMAAIGTAGITAGYAGRALNATEAGKPLFTMEQIKQRAARSYTDIDNSGITVKPQSTLNMITDIRGALKDARMIPDTPEALTIEKTLKEMENVVGTQKVPFSTLDRLRQMANDVKGSKDAKESRLGGVMVDTIDNYISKLNGKVIISGKDGIDAAVKKITEARKDWRNASRAQVLEDALNVAEAKALDPKASESDLIRRGFINIAASKQKMGLFTPEEQNVIKGVANGGNLDSILSFFGQFNPFRSKLAAAGSAAFATQSPTTAALVAGGGLAADTLQGILRRRAAEAASKTIASGAAGPIKPNYAYRGLLTTGLVRPDTNQ